jgi:hypothetical protein
MLNPANVLIAGSAAKAAVAAKTVATVSPAMNAVASAYAVSPDERHAAVH